MKLKLNKANLAMLDFGTKLKTGNKTYYYLPFWFEQTGDEDVVEVHGMLRDDMPNELVQLINEKREIDAE